MEYSAKTLTMRLGNKEVDLFPYWLALLIAGILFGLVGAYEVFTKGLQVVDHD